MNDNTRQEASDNAEIQSKRVFEIVVSDKMMALEDREESHPNEDDHIFNLSQPEQWKSWKRDIEEFCEKCAPGLKEVLKEVLTHA